MKRVIPGVGLLSVVLLVSAVAFAETIELVTYYPSSATVGQVEANRLHAGRATVGAPYSMTNPADANLTDGTLLVSDRVGIGPVFGTTPPAGALHVVGANDTLDRVLFMPGADTPAAGRPDIRVGIGTQNPQAMLDIQHPQDAAYVRVMGTGDATNFSGLELRSDEAVDKIWQIVHKQAAGLNDLHVNYFDGAAWSTKMAIQPGGNVGIGVTTPGVKLDVAQNTAVRVGNAYLSSGDYPNRLANFGVNAWYAGGAAGTNWVFPNPGQRASVIQLLDDSLHFYTNASGTAAGWTNRLDITANGNVGIGTTAPGTRLTLQNPGPGGQDVLELRDTGNGTGSASAIVWKNASGVPKATIFQTGAGNSFRFTAAGDIMFNAGAVGFTPAAERMIISTNGYVYANIQPYSDATQKTQIQPLAGALERVAALRGITYRWKDKALDQQKQMGFSAQEVEKVFPELVRIAPNGLKTVAYDHLTAALVEAVKELKHQNEAQQREIEVLKKRLPR